MTIQVFLITYRAAQKEELVIPQ